MDRALKLIRVRYQVLEAVLDPHEALDSPILIHPEDSWRSLCPVGADNRRNLCASETCSDGDVDQVLAGCPCVVDRVYHTKACNQAMMETFRTYTEMDPYGRAPCGVLHPDRLPRAAHPGQRPGHPQVQDPRGEAPASAAASGAKQTVVAEVYPATGHLEDRPPRQDESIPGRRARSPPPPATRWRSMCAWGATRDGVIRALDVYTLSNTGAYGEHGPTTVGLSGHKSIPLYTGNLEAFRFAYDVVYTNRQSAGAYRGYGATRASSPWSRR